MQNHIEELVLRAQAVVSSPKKNYTEMGLVHQAITGTHYACTPCNERRILFTLNSFITNPERYALRIKEAQTEMEQNQTTNYRFSKNATSTLIVLVAAGGATIAVTPENLTDEKAEMVLAHKAYAHNIERIPGTEPEEETGTGTGEGNGETTGEGDTDPAGPSNGENTGESNGAPTGEDENPVANGTEGTETGKQPETPPTELTLEQAQARYKELLGHAPGNRNLNTLLTAIKKAEESK